MKGRSWLMAVVFILAVIAVHGVAVAIKKPYCLTQLTMAAYYAIVVIGLCVLMGYAGQISLGHGAFFAIGGYASAFLTTHDFSAFQDTAWAGLLKSLHVFTMREDVFGNQIMTVVPGGAFLVGVAGTILIAALIGYPALRLRGHYLAMATLGFGLIVQKMFLGSALLGAADGITGVPGWDFLGVVTIANRSAVRIQNYYFACALILILLLLLGNMLRSRVGRALFAIHDQETAANAIGINTPTYKLKAFIVSAVLAAVAGAFFTHYTGGIGPSEAGPLKSVKYVALAAAGGMASPWGAGLVSSAIVYLSLRDWFGNYDNAVFGGLLIVIMSIAPNGPLKPLGVFVRNGVARVFTRPEAAISDEQKREA